jgi:hypothetical protein
MTLFGLKLFGRTVIGGDAPAELKLPPLMTRYILFRCAAFGVYLHHFTRSDHDRALHDHPWPFVAIVLKGGYLEIHNQHEAGHEVIETHKPGAVLIRPAEWRHRVVLPAGRTSWSLTIVGRRKRRWGFYTPSGWCWWRQYDPWKAICEDRVIYEGGED